MSSASATAAAPSGALRILAYSAIYFLWGASFLAIRVIVASAPPLLAAAVRFLLAGVIVSVWSLARGTPFPKLQEWRSAMLLGAVMFACDYGPLFWAEQRVPSGVAAIISALIPVWIAAFEWSRSGSRMPLRLLVGTMCGLAGVAALSLTPGHRSGQRIELLPLLALLAGTIAWSIGTLWSRHLPLPNSRPLSAGIQMMLGGLTLALVSVLSGDAFHFAPAQLTFPVIASTAYLVFGASILAFTAYVWLLSHEPATHVSSYAYVNPVIAVLLGWSLGGERLTIQIISGMVLVLAAVISVVGARRN